MKYFTIAWWMGETDDESHDPVTIYRERVASIKSMIPDSLTMYIEEISLHDSKIKEIDVNIPERRIRISTTTWDKGGSEILNILQYDGVERYASCADYKKGLPGPHGYGDWGYDEIDIDKNGLLSHRILFSSGITIDITFKIFSFSEQSFHI